MCGKMIDHCLNEVDLFSCPNLRDECTADHKCVCDPQAFDPNYECGWEGDGCGRNQTFGTLGGSCASSDHVCHNHMCCTPKTASDFSSAWECGTADDGCGGIVDFSQGVTENLGCGPGRSVSCGIDHKCETRDSIYACSFEEPPAGNRFCDLFDNEKGPGSKDITWTPKSGSTSSSKTGPASAEHGSYYLYTEATGSYNRKALLKSIPLKVSATGALVFWYHMYGKAMGNLTVQVLEDGSSTDVWSKSGDQGNTWHDSSFIDLSGFADRTIQIVFDGQVGSDYRSDISIDDIEIF